MAWAGRPWAQGAAARPSARALPRPWAPGRAAASSRAGRAGGRTPAGSVMLPAGVGGTDPGFFTLSWALQAGHTMTPAASGRALTSARQRGQIMGGGKYTGLDGVVPLPYSRAMALQRLVTVGLARRLFGSVPARTQALIRAAWPRAVGADLARRTEVVALEAGTLRIRVPDARWRKVLHRMQPQILARLRDVVGDLAPRRLGFVEGPMAVAAPDEPSAWSRCRRPRPRRRSWPGPRPSTIPSCARVSSRWRPATSTDRRTRAMREAVILSAVRLPTGKFLGALKGFTAPQLGAMVVGEAVKRAGVEPRAVDEVIMGNVVSAGLGQAPARQAAIGAGLPPEVAALTINKVCGSGLKAVMLAAQGIATGDADVVVAGGMESMSNAPYLLTRAREGLRLGHGELVDSMIHDGLWEAYEDYHMGCCGEIVAEQVRRGPPAAGRVRAGEPPPGDRRHQGRQVQGRDPARADPPEEGRAGPVRHRRGAARGHVARDAGQAQARLQGGRHRDRRQRAGRQRRRRGAGRHLGRAGEGARPEADGPHRGPGRLRRGADDGDDVPGGRGAEALGEDRLERRRAWTSSS